MRWATIHWSATRAASAWSARLNWSPNKETKQPFDASWGVAAHVGERALKHGLITRALGDTINFCPPLIISEAEIADMYARAKLALDDTYAWVQAGPSNGR